MKTKIKYGIVIGTGIIIFGILGVQAASVVPSNGVLYSNSNSTVTTVEGALNELYAGVEHLKSIGTASASDILSGKTALIQGNEVTGTIASLAATTYTPSTSNQTIAAGKYLSGAQTIVGDADLISANIKSGANIFGVAGNANVVDTSSGDATAAQILSGKKAYVDGKLVTGSIASLAAKTYTPGTSNQTIAAGKYLSGAQTIAGDADLKAANIKSGVELFGVTGTYTSDANATAAQILSGKKAYVDGKLVTGTRTAQNNSYKIIGRQVDNHSKAASTAGFNYTSTATGKVIIFVGGAGDSGSFSSYYSYAVTKNGTAVTATANNINAWNGTAYYTFNVVNGDVIAVSSSVTGSAGVNSVFAFGMLVS